MLYLWKEKKMQKNLVKNQMSWGVAIETTVTGWSLDHTYCLVKKPIYKESVINSFMVKYHANSKGNTKIAYNSILNNFLDAMPETEDGEIILDSNSVSAYLYRMQNVTGKTETYSQNKKLKIWNKVSTRRVKQIMIRKFLFFLFKEQYTEVDLSEEVIVPRKSKTEKYVPSDAKVGDFFTSLKSLYKNERERLKFYTIFKMYCLTGFRKMELINLDYGDINFDRNIIFLRNTKSSENDTFPISNQIRKILLSYIDEFNITDGPLFRGKCGKNGVKRIYDYVVEENFNRIKKLANLPSGFTIQSLRRYAIDYWRRNGADIYTLKKLARHKDINTTYEYCNVKDKELMEVLDKKEFNF